MTKQSSAADVNDRQQDVRYFPAQQLHECAVVILKALGTPSDEAAIVAESLVSAHLAGHDSHGLIRLPEYASFVERGLVNPAARPAVSTTGAAVAVDGNQAWGQVAMRLATDHIATTAETFGVSGATARNCGHVGRIGEYAERLAGAGLIGLIICNADPTVAPMGGRERRLGTNPIAIGVPNEREPVILDFASSAVAEGKLRIARATGRAIPPGLIQDEHGHPSTNATDFYDGGALLPFGGHKGYGLSVMIELIAGALSGNHPSCLPSYKGGNGVVAIAIRPSAFNSYEAFLDDVSRAATLVRGTPPLQADSPVLLPGDPEHAMRIRRGGQGIPIEQQIWASIQALADQLGVQLPD
jgi:uncharacterized oxidoreductase